MEEMLGLAVTIGKLLLTFRAVCFMENKVYWNIYSKILINDANYSIFLYLAYFSNNIWKSFSEVCERNDYESTHMRKKFRV